MVVARIPKGRVTTYGRIAAALGSPRASHVVGSALANLPAGHDLPAHRVVNRTGYLSGAEAWGNPDIMRDLLHRDGVPFRAAWEVDLEACVWEPADDPDLDHLFRPGGERLP
jgi:methylated-DNA-protein-cysteine methyltransferase-like protein